MERILSQQGRCSWRWGFEEGVEVGPVYQLVQLIMSLQVVLLAGVVQMKVQQMIKLHLEEDPPAILIYQIV